jgi:signal transduction histidine kinase
MPIFDIVIVSFIGAGSLLLSAIFLIKNHRRLLNIIAAVLSISVAIWIVSAYLSDLQSLQHYSLFLNRFLLTAVSGVIVSMFFLSFHFPSSTKLHPFISAITLLITALISITTVFTPLTIQSITFEAWGTNPQYGWMFTVFSTFLTLLIIVSTYKFIRTYRLTKGLHKLQMRYLFFGIFLFMLINLFVHTVISHLVGSVEYYKFGNYSAILFIIFLYLAIINHRLMDIRLIIARSVAYTLLVVTVAILYLLPINFIEKTIFSNSISPHQMTVSTTITLILLFLFQPLQRIILTTTQKVFFKNLYSTQELINQIGELMRSNTRLSPLLNPIMDLLGDALKVDSVQIVLETDQIIVSKFSAKEIIPSPSPNAYQNLSSLSDLNILIFDELEESSKKSCLRHFNIGSIIPLKTSVKLHGFLILGEKESGEAYSSQDIDTLEILAPQLSIAVQNALSYEEINQFNQTLKQEIDKATADLKTANQELKHLDKLKDEFVFVATHELKNPVTAMRGYLSMFQEGLFGEIPEKMKQPMDQLQSSNQQLVELVNDLLQIARSEAQTLTIKTEPVNLCPTIDSVIQNLTPLANQKGLEMIHHCPGSIPQVTADSQRVREILNNLLSNAIKYSDKGTITVSHQLKTDQLITHITDQGVGISPADQKRLFTRFFRVEEEAAKGIPGTGLGLFIVKQLIEKMGGQIWVTSEKDHGSTFSFSLPTA